jgi:hypothetical protein
MLALLDGAAGTGADNPHESDSHGAQVWIMGLLDVRTHQLTAVRSE